MDADALLLSALTVLHGLSSGVLAGASIHKGWLAWGVLNGRVTWPERLRRLYPSVIAIAFFITFGLGLIIYPSFRVEVRAAWLDAQAPGVTMLFELKEHGVAIAALLLTYLVPQSRRPKEELGRFYTLAALMVSGLVSYALIVGLFISTMRAS